jgi:hypothetical protein
VDVPILRDAPALTAAQDLALLAWRDLAGERQMGFALGPIPWRAITAWCDRYRVADPEGLIELVQAIDVEWLSATTGPQSAGDPANPQSPKRH